MVGLQHFSLLMIQLQEKPADSRPAGQLFLPAAGRHRALGSLPHAVSVGKNWLGVQRRSVSCFVTLAPSNLTLRIAKTLGRNGLRRWPVAARLASANVVDFLAIPTATLTIPSASA